jgi:redox-sensitive bicupin YhaK (pirin superfamily)
MRKIELVIPSREKDLGSFSVRRILPYASHRMVGPFIFFDHMGPADFPPGQGMTVRPHPHIHLSTVTYLFDGVIHHRDSLGSDQLIEPGDINWMTAGNGIVHSERSPESFKKTGGKVNGIQCWVALPEEHQDVEPSFHHHPSETLPEFEINGAKLKLLLGSAFNRQSPVKVHSDLFYLDVNLPQGSELHLPCDGREGAVYLVNGRVEAGDVTLEPYSMAVGHTGEPLVVKALTDSRFMLLGGKSVGERFIYWNFISTSKENLEKAKADWAAGPGNTKRFPKISGDDNEFIPLPPEDVNPPGTPL